MPATVPLASLRSKAVRPPSHEAGPAVASSEFTTTLSNGHSVKSISSQSIAELAALAQGNNEEAIELLLNIAGGNELAEDASRRLLSLYATSRRPDIRASIEQQADALFALEKLSAPRPDKKDKADKTAPLVSVPASLLYLAGVHARETKATNRATEIEAKLQSQCFPAGVASERLLEKDRFITSDELLVRTRGFRQCPVHSVLLEHGNDNFPEQLRIAVAAGLPRSVFVNVNGNHWVTLVLRANREDASKLDVLCFDSNARIPEGSMHRLETACEEAGLPIATWVTEGGLLQEHAPHSCGAYAVWVAQVSDELSGADEDCRLEETLSTLRVHWERSGADDLHALVIAERAFMLQCLADTRPREPAVRLDR
ncbi:hypothetical protein JI739_04030 [Ramlibacter sp. AW1]|uniref:Ubiquitin-like protease family profile domain-containing protein n=1 Tax=Ramlibacter aurantiacus TaxID=2801330 RepID=A0A937D672_9BURK|nr:hypothetical protein [Ramlibacter aurantiacus]MBL0419511.1 hypothetical protein [Ramlibacter aurantiacus]